MAKADDKFRKELQAVFKAEAEDHVRVISDGILELHQSPAEQRRQEILETVFREAHSLKGAARAVGESGIETICQTLESAFFRIKGDPGALSPALLDTFHEAAGILAERIGLSGASPKPGKDVGPVLRALENAERDNSPRVAEDNGGGPRLVNSPKVEERPAPVVMPAASEKRQTIRIDSEKLKTLSLKAEELRSAKLLTAQRAADTRGVFQDLARSARGRRKVRFEFRRLAQSLHAASQDPHHGLNGHRTFDAQMAGLQTMLDEQNSQLEAIETKANQLARLTEQDHRSLAGMVDTLLDEARGISMFPFSSLLDSFPRLVHDLARDQGKEAVLTTQNAEIEIDRRILEEIKDPLMHLLRNSIDHGIETPEARLALGKPRRGEIRIGISPERGGMIEITISDDGAGLDAARIRTAAVEKGILSKEDSGRMDDADARALIFRSGFSTRDTVTNISGRGLGLAIVREKTEKLGGSIVVESAPQAGALFRILVPLTLATFRGILVRVDGLLVVLPTAHVERVVRIGRGEITTVENRDTLQFEGQPMSVVRLRDALDLPTNAPLESSEHVYAVILKALDKRIAFLVDWVLREQEMLLKNLGPFLPRVRNISGATVLASGELAAVLSAPDLIKSAIRMADTGTRIQAHATTATPLKSILVAEDSITSRTLLKQILESSGYRVKTAMDGVEALSMLRAGEFDLLVSDVEMPRMNGFDLTAQVRADRRLGDLPVILVTGLESRQDRERGIDVGANGYIVKSSFDQGDLLQAVRNLV